MKYVDPETSMFDTLETGIFLKRKHRIQIISTVWLMTFVAFMALNTYYINFGTVDKTTHISTLLMVVILCLSVSVFMVPR